MANIDREKTVAVAFARWLNKEATDEDWDTFKRNLWYQSIPKPEYQILTRIDAENLAIDFWDDEPELTELTSYMGGFMACFDHLMGYELKLWQVESFEAITEALEEIRKGRTEESIPVSVIQKRIDELRNELNEDGVLSYTNQDQIEILTKLLEP